MSKKKYEIQPERMVITCLSTRVGDMQKINDYFAAQPDLVKGFECTRLLVESINRQELEDAR